MWEGMDPGMGDRPENGNEDVEYCYVGAHTNSPKPEINHPEDNQWSLDHDCDY